ncbi:hypothetical protein [Marinobacter sp. Arc7-DN-1]|uniref:hypothetical protein n=1 Tax=Marinobacter sp. Arc7-DN-1 TaxID=2304594 RepID=UPI000E43E953|nr:hypothetical protein [Marinobacter sp. Arc7-DN-1]AXS84272.1 hypothetical protein D0851_15275 [Marinobacter sp. Arc7-DN-1]
MDNRFAVSLHDVDPWRPTDEERQEEVVKRLMDECEVLGEAKPSIMTFGFRTNSSTAQIANDLVSGLSLPALISSAGYVLKHLAPLIIEYLKTRPQKEVTIDYKGHRVTVRGGGDVAKELQNLIRKIDETESGGD